MPRLACTKEGLFLGGTPLIERRGGRYAVRPRGELERLLGRGYGASQWQSGIATLREIDPGNPQLSSLTAPGWVPSQADLDVLDGAITTAETRRLLNKIMPGGAPIGEPGSSPDIRELPGGATAARELFDYLRVGGKEATPNPNTVVVRLPGGAGYVTFRPVSRSGDPAIILTSQPSR